MTILQINTTINWGSTGKIAEQIGLLVKAQGGENYIAHSYRYENPSKSIPIRLGGRWSNKIHRWYGKFDRHGLASNASTRKLISKIKEINPQVVHLHNLHGGYLNYKMLFEYLCSTSIPIVWTLHDCWPFTGHCAYFDAVGCERWKTGCHDCPALRTYPKAKYADNSTRNYALKKRLFTSAKNVTIVPVSAWLSGLVGESFLGKLPRRVIYNGVDVGVFSPQKTELRSRYGIAPSKRVLLGVASNWEARKGLKDFIALSKELSAEYVIVVVGVDERQKRELPDNMIGVMRTQNQQELAEYYSMADIVLNLSYQETFGLTTVEGFACGTPSIVYDVTASPELVTPETGIKVPAGDLAAVKRAIETICGNGKAHYSEACRRRAEECYDKEKCFNQYLELYKELSNNNK